LISFALGWFILELDDQAVLVATLAFASVVNLLLITEKWLTKGVVGLGVVDFPYDIGAETELSFLVLLSGITIGLMWYARRIRGQPFGRLLVAIQDNERLAQGLGKPSFRTKLVVFTVSGALMGLIGAMSASIHQFLVPQMVLPTMTFTVWIALVLGGRRHWAGALIGGIIVVGVFDIALELWFELPREYQQLMPQLKFLVYGLLLMALIMYRPQGLLGVYRPRPPKESRGGADD
jgi:branched-chain amino acid transport system permease protein